MGLNIKDEEAVDLVTEVAKRSGRSKTATVRELARAELVRLVGEEADLARARKQELTEFLEQEIWDEPHAPLSKPEVESILGLDRAPRQGR